MLLLWSAEAPELDPETTKEHQYEAIPGPGPDTSQGDAWPSHLASSAQWQSIITDSDTHYQFCHAGCQQELNLQEVLTGIRMVFSLVSKLNGFMQIFMQIKLFRHLTMAMVDNLSSARNVNIL